MRNYGKPPQKLGKMAPSGTKIPAARSGGRHPLDSSGKFRSPFRQVGAPNSPNPYAPRTTHGGRTMMDTRPTAPQSRATFNSLTNHMAAMHSAGFPRLPNYRPGPRLSKNLDNRTNPSSYNVPDIRPNMNEVKAPAMRTPQTVGPSGGIVGGTRKVPPIGMLLRTPNSQMGFDRLSAGRRSTMSPMPFSQMSLMRGRMAPSRPRR
jgi:hypothetical protein